MRKGKDRCKAWKRRILPGCQPLAPLMSLPRCRRRTAEPAHRSRGTGGPFTGYRDVAWARPPHRRPWSGQGARAVRRPDAGCGSAPPSIRLSILWPAGPPLPQRNGAGAGGGGGQGWGSLPWLEPLPGDPSLPAGFAPGRLPAALPRRVIFSRAGTRAQGAGLPSMSRFLPCSAVAGSWEPGPPLPLPWKLAPALGKAPRPQFPPQEAGREGGRRDIRLFAPQPRPQA